jgi:cell division protein FtsB
VPFEPATAARASRAHGTYVTLTFWLSLLVSGALFAAATLSVKILETERHTNELASQSARVEQLALNVHRLELEVRALETDTDYIAAIARQKLGGRPATPSIPARIVESPPQVTIGSFDPRLDPLRPWMIRIASDSLLRARLLTIAAALILFAFTFLHERPIRVASASDRNAS